MSINKNATIRYQTLDRCLRNPGRRYYMEDLLESCNEALLDINPGSTGVKRRQIYEDIKFMKDSLGFNAPIISIKDGRRAYYQYEDLNFSITNQPLNELEAQQLKESLLTLSRFKGMPQFDWVQELTVRLEQSFNLKSEEHVLSFDENIYLKGREFIGELYNAIINKQVLSIEYLPFKNENVITFVIHPYYLKQYNNRWFLFGLNSHKQITNLALDRINTIKPCDEKYIENSNLDLFESFEDIIGVTFPFERIIEKVLIRVDTDLWPYIETKPLHGSQKMKEKTDKFTIIELELMINHELKSTIFSFGEKVQVLKPDSLKMTLLERSKQMYQNYNMSAD